MLSVKMPLLYVNIIAIDGLYNNSTFERVKVDLCFCWGEGGGGCLFLFFVSNMFVQSKASVYMVIYHVFHAMCSNINLEYFTLYKDLPQATFC